MSAPQADGLSPFEKGGCLRSRQRDSDGFAVKPLDLKSQLSNLSLKTPSQAFTRKISRLIAAVAILRTDSLSMLPPLEMTGYG